MVSIDSVHSLITLLLSLIYSFKLLLCSTGDSNEFYCYFPPPLPDVVVVFCTNWPEAVPDRMNIQLYLDSEDKSICKSIGKISKDARASCFNGNWERDEQLISEEIQENVS